MQSVTALAESFRQKGLKITPQRRLIFEALVGDHSHPTADDVYQRVVPALPNISRTTVYNTLGELVALGELVEIDLGEGHEPLAPPRSRRWAPPIRPSCAADSVLLHE